MFLFFAFSWSEHLWADAALPFNIGISMLGYAAASFLGMMIYGREVWLRHGEVFALVFDLFARFAPFELRVPLGDEPKRCDSTDCGASRTECINGYICLDGSDKTQWELNLRPPAVGLLNDKGVTISMSVFVMLVLSSVAFDGLIETPQWYGALDSMLLADSPNLLAEVAAMLGTNPAILIASCVLSLMPLIFFLLLGVCCWSMRLLYPALKGAGRDNSISMPLVSSFVLSLLPIGIAYHLAHYFTVLIDASQRIIALSSDPLSVAWNLFGSGSVVTAREPVALQIIWYIVVAAIVCGHIFSVYIAHVVTVNLCSDHRHVVRGQLPIIVLMVAYTMCSIWLLAQPSYA